MHPKSLLISISMQTQCLFLCRLISEDRPHRNLGTDIVCWTKRSRPEGYYRATTSYDRRAHSAPHFSSFSIPMPMHFHGHIEKVGNQCKLGQCLLTYARAHPPPNFTGVAATFCSVVSDFLKMKAMNNSERDAWLMSLFATKQNRIEVAKSDHHAFHFVAHVLLRLLEFARRRCARKFPSGTKVHNNCVFSNLVARHLARKPGSGIRPSIKGARFCSRLNLA